MLLQSCCAVARDIMIIAGTSFHSQLSNSCRGRNSIQDGLHDMLLPAVCTCAFTLAPVAVEGIKDATASKLGKAARSVHG